MNGKNVVITGVNRGIGLELARIFKKMGAQVTGICRKKSEELNKINLNIVDGIDISEVSCREKVCREMGDRKIDILINNAGILHCDSIDDLSSDNIEKQFVVNALSPLMLTKDLKNNLKDGSKVALITSRMGSISDNGSGGYYGYRMSKAALNACGMSLSLDLKSRGVSVGIIHPGYVKTEMTNMMGNISPEEAAEGIIKRIENLNINNSGDFWHSNGEKLPW